MNIQSCSSYPAFLQGLSQSFLIYQTATRRVDKERTLTHLNRQKKKYKEKGHLGDIDDFNFKTSHRQEENEIIISKEKLIISAGVKFSYDPPGGSKAEPSCTIMHNFQSLS